MISQQYVFVATFGLFTLLWASPFLFYTLSISSISFGLGLGLGRYRDILYWLKEGASQQRYSYLVDRLLDAIERMDIDETRELLVDFIYFVQGTTRYRPIRYVGNTFMCPISKEELKTGDHVLILPCGHKGKYEDMKLWVDSHTTCPECRQSC